MKLYERRATFVALARQREGIDWLLKPCFGQTNRASIIENGLQVGVANLDLVPQQVTGVCIVSELRMLPSTTVHVAVYVRGDLESLLQRLERMKALARIGNRDYSAENNNVRVYLSEGKLALGNRAYWDELPADRDDLQPMIDLDMLAFQVHDGPLEPVREALHVLAGGRLSILSGVHEEVERVPIAGRFPAHLATLLADCGILTFLDVDDGRLRVLRYRFGAEAARECQQHLDLWTTSSTRVRIPRSRWREPIRSGRLPLVAATLVGLGIESLGALHGLPLSTLQQILPSSEIFEAFLAGLEEEHVEEVTISAPQGPDTVPPSVTIEDVFARLVEKPVVLTGEIMEELSKLGEGTVSNYANLKRRLEEAGVTVESGSNAPPPEEPTVDEGFLSRPLSSLTLQNRTLNSLMKAGVVTVGQALAQGRAGLMGVRGFGQGCLDDLEARLAVLVQGPLPWFVDDPVGEGQEQGPLPLPVLVARLDEQMSGQRCQVLKLRYGLGGESPVTLAEAATILSDPPLSRERIRQIERAALRELAARKDVRVFVDTFREELERRDGFVHVDDLVDLPLWGADSALAKGFLQALHDAGPDCFCHVEDIAALDSAVIERYDALLERLQATLVPPLGRSEVIECASTLVGGKQALGERLVDRFWKLEFTSVDGALPVLMRFEGGRVRVADLAVQYLMEHESLRIDDLMKFTALKGLGHSTRGVLTNAVGADSRLFLIDTGTYTLRSRIQLDREEMDTWFEFLLTECWQLGEVTNTRFLYQRLDSAFDLPKWLNEHSLFWLLREDSRFRTLRRLEVCPAAADWQRMPLSERLEQLFEESSAPLHITEISKRLATVRPVPPVSILQALEQEDVFFRVGPSIWGAVHKLELPPDVTTALQRAAQRCLATNPAYSLKCGEIRWRVDIRDVDAYQVDLALSRDPSLVRLGYGCYRLAVEMRDQPSAADPADVLRKVLLEGQRPLRLTEAVTEVGKRSVPLSPAALQGHLEGAVGIVRFLVGKAKWFGLSEWTAEQWQHAVFEEWGLVRNQVLRDGARSLAPVVREAIAIVARDLIEGGVLDEVLREGESTLAGEEGAVDGTGNVPGEQGGDGVADLGEGGVHGPAEEKAVGE